MMTALMRTLLLCSLLSAATACSIGNRRDGVDNRWRVLRVDNFKNKVTREDQVLKLLGPPSRVIALRNRTVFYYLLEHNYSVGLNLIVFINRDTEVKYDRAVFFFDKDGVLQQHSFSREALPTGEDK